MGAPEKLPPMTNSMQRVKVYRLNDDGKWDDQGTGHVTVDYLERSEELGLFVIDEEDNETLLVHRISSDDIYRKQEDTIISWRDAEYSSELALSFQENTGCSYIWDNICSVQRNLHFSSLSNEAYHSSANSELRELPAVELSALPLILKTVVDSSVSEQLRVTELILHDQDFFRKLMDLFRICEDLDNIDGLHMMYKIVRGIMLLNSPQIFEKIFGDELIMDIIGSLEYEPGAPRVHHRSFLKEHVVFKEAIPIKDPLVLSKIHQTYRVGYLKDVVLARVLDDHTAASFNSIIHSNNAAVVSLLKDDSTFIQELFVRLKSSTTSADSKKNLVFFLQEFCSLSKSLQMVQQLRLFRDLVNEGIFDIITDILQSHDKKLVLTGTDILILFLNQDPNLLRSYVTRPEGVPLLGLLVKGMLTDFGDDMHCQFLEILRSLLDSYTSGGQRDTIIEIFYEKHLVQLIDVITASCPNGAVQAIGQSASLRGSFGSQSSAKPEILVNICDLLCFCVLHHPYRIKCNFLLNGVVDKVLFLTGRTEKYLVVAAVRFVRTLISRNDEHLMNHIVKNNIFKPIIDTFVSNGSRYNLLNSAVLELFEYIRKENFKILVKYLIESFWDQLVKFENLASIQSLKVRYEQNLDNPEMISGPDLLDSRRRIDERALEKEEEDYFNEESDEEDSASASVSAPRSSSVRAQPSLSNGSAASYPSVRSGGLVDYEDDEDDEDYKPPPKKQGATWNKDEEVPDPRLKRKLLASKEETVLRVEENHKPPPRKPRVVWHSEELEPAELENIRAKRKQLGPKEEPSLHDDEDYKPPPRKQSVTWHSEEVDDLVLPKRKLLASKEEPELLKKQRLGKNSKSKESVFASLCSTLSQAVLPSKKTSGVLHNVSHSSDLTKSNGEGDHEEKGSEVESGKTNSSSDDGDHEDNVKAASKSCLDSDHTASRLDTLHTPDNRQLVGDDCPLVPPKSSPEMAVNGS